MSPSLGANDNGQERLWFDDDVTSADDRPASFSANLVGLGFITAALRRSKWLWSVAAVVGLLAGSGLYLKTHTYQASTTLQLTVGAEPQPGTAIQEDQVIAQSHEVATLTLQKLGLHQSVDSFLGSYIVTPLTDQDLLITASAPSSNEAVRRATALATEFLAFRANKLLAEQQLEITALDQQITEDKQLVASISKQISQLSAQAASSSRGARLGTLRAEFGRASNDLTALEQTVTSNVASIKANTATMIAGSQVLDPASPVPPHSRKKRLFLYVGGGFIIGLILGVTIVVVRALLSERLRRRDDVAEALGAPVRSVPAVRVSRRLPGRSMRASGYYLRRIVGYLYDAVPAGSRGPAALAVVPIGEPWVAAMSVVSLAESCAQEGARVVVADLTAAAPAAALLGAKGPGVRTVSVDGADIVAAVPDPAEFAPIGPLRPASSRAEPAIAGELVAACAAADLLLTLIPLDPSVGGEHLATWAADAVVVVTAGQSSWTKIHAVGEMIRLAGTRLASAVLVGADRTDESLGVGLAPGTGRGAVTTRSSPADMGGSFARDPGGRTSDHRAMFKLQMDPPERVGQRQRTGR